MESFIVIEYLSNDIVTVMTYVCIHRFIYYTMNGETLLVPPFSLLQENLMRMIQIVVKMYV